MNKKLLPLKKDENPKQYAKLANEGLLLGYPVQFNGEHARPDNGVHYHSSIKFFDPAKDHPHAIHNLAQHLPLNPPDAKNTQIEPGQFKDRLGNDVFVIKLKGNSADKIKEHNGKFSHMGFPANHEFTPHISVDKARWDAIKDSGAKTAHEAGISFGPAELKRGPKTLKTYHHEPDSAEPRVPDESDFTAKIPIAKSWITDKDAHDYIAEKGKKGEEHEIKAWKEAKKIAQHIPPPGKHTYKELSLHHGTKSKQPFDKFDMKHHASGFYPGVYTSSDPEEAKKHGTPVKVGFKGHLFDIQGPKHAEELHQHVGGGGSGHKLVQHLKNAGYHGIKRGTEHIIFDPEHAKIQKSEKFCALHKAEAEAKQNDDFSEGSDLENENDADEDAHALLNRREDKYFLPRKYIEHVISELSVRLAFGDIDTDTRYCRNRTIYMDDKDLTSFRDVISKTKPRTKVRIRQYNPNNNGWEEVAYAEFKVKEEDGETKKIRVRIPVAYIDELAEGGKIVFNETLVNINRDLERKIVENRVTAINNAISRKGLHKQLEVQYERRAYSGKNLRITIDDDLNFFDSRSIDPIVKDNIHKNEDWNRFLKPYMTAAWNDPLILEVKTDKEPPSWLAKLLKEVEAKEASFSKYAAAMVTHLRTTEKDGKILSLFEEAPDPLDKSENLENLTKSEKKRKSVDIAVVVLRDGHFVLMGKRRRNKKWGLPGGRSEGKSEDTKTTALRELEEETGLKLKDNDLTLSGIREIKNKHEYKRIYVYTAKYPGGEPTTKYDPDQEFTAWRWVRCEDGQLPNEVLDNEMSPPTEAAFDELNMTKDEVDKSEHIHGQKPLMKPFLSEAQRRWGHTAAGKKALGGEAGVHEWDEATKGKKLPERVAKSESEIKSLIKSDHTLHRFGKALSLTGESFRFYLEDNKALKKLLEDK